MEILGNPLEMAAVTDSDAGKPEETHAPSREIPQWVRQSSARRNN
jgi:hypothetical protein